MKISIKLNDKTLDMWIGSTSMKVNNTNKTIDVAPFTINGRTMVPVRFVAENFGYEVEWNQKTQTAIIK